MSDLNKTTLRRRVQDAPVSASDRSQLLALVDKAADTPDALKALQRRITATCGGVTKSYNRKVPNGIQTK